MSLRQPANNGVGNVEQAGLVKSSDIAPKRRHLDSESEGTKGGLLGLARCASKRRNHILHINITRDQLSAPAFYIKLPFPFVGLVVPTRFEIDPGDNEDNWFFMGREKFAELLKMLEDVRKRRNLATLWVYGSKGYGKSHLLAALVCYLISRKERVVYIPDCRECLKDPVSYVRTAMLFAWGDDKIMQRAIMTLDTQEKIAKFFTERCSHGDAIFVIDQLDALAELEEDGHAPREKKENIFNWLQACRSNSIFQFLAAPPINLDCPPITRPISRH
jgi:Cdc6-like AAA superfamily ATPase